MYISLLQKTKNKILRTIDTIPHRQYQSELAYQAAVEKYIPHIVNISQHDLEIVEKIKQEGIFITSLAELGIASTPAFIQAAQNLMPKIAQSPVLDNQKFVIHATSKQIVEYPIIFLWGLEQRLLNIVENFFGLPVAYHGVYFRRDIANGLEKGSRLWHIDKEARKILKIIVYLHDMDENNGPFQYIPHYLTTEIAKSLKYKSGYIRDQSMQEVTSTSNYQSCTGIAGTVIFAATHSMFHRGKIPVNSDRFSIFFDYTPKLKEHSFYIASSLPDEDLAVLTGNLSESKKEYIYRRN
jgi:hypothetical protein